MRRLPVAKFLIGIIKENPDFKTRQAMLYRGAMSHYSEATKQAAKSRYLAGKTVSAICDELNINSRRVIYNWRDQEQWDEEARPENVLLTTSRRFNDLIDRDNKNKTDLEELSTLADILLKLEKVEALKRGENIGSGRPPGVKNGEGKPKRRKKNDISHITQARCNEVREKLLYPHQKIWYEAGQNPLTSLVRFILKSRQVGATFTFAYEALETAILTGRNQIFISSTKAQAEVFKSYMTVIAMEHFECELSGNPVKLSNGAELHFLSPNSYAQSRSGDVYFDEVFWTRSFTKMEELAAPMATLEGCKTTYFSTPSAISHPAYEIWSGERYTKHHQQVEVDVTDHAGMKYGKLFADGIWRCVCSVYDAIDLGWNLITVEKLKIKTPDPTLFSNIYGCKFVDDTHSVFKLSDLLDCAVDVTKWTDFDNNAPRPIGDKPCTGGYDPAGEGDNASFVILTRPESVEEKFRMLRKHVWKGMRAPSQCAAIERECETFNLEYIEIDSTGPGAFVGDFVESFFPRVERIRYSPEYKTRMVQKAQSVISGKRFEYPDTDITLPLAFMTVYQTTTDKGIITYASSRNNKVGHGDEAWATMHALMCEQLNPQQRTMTFSSF